MTSSENSLPRPAEPWRSPFQFSLRTLLIGVTAVAILCSLLVASPPWVRALTTLFLAVAVPAALTTMVIHSRGYTRTFAIGALFPAIVPVYSFALLRGSTTERVFSDSPEAGIELAITIAVALVFIVAVGLVAMGVRWMCEEAERRRGTASDETAAHDPTLFR